MLWLVWLALVIGACVTAYLMDRRDRRHGHQPGSGQALDTTYLEQRSFAPGGMDIGGGGSM